MTMMEHVQRFIATYPPLASSRLNVDFLPEDASSYAVEAIPAKKVIKTYLGGAKVCQFLFVLASREFYGQEIRQQIENLGFYEDFAAWLELKTRGGDLPILGEGKEAIKLEATTSGYAFSADMDNARYQIQCRLEYMEE